jgi:2-dehydropantoate 2-reductase
MKIVILGAGAVGRMFGVFFSRSGHSVILVDPDVEVVRAVNSRGIGYLGQGSAGHDEVEYFPARAVEHAGEVENADFVILAVKSFDTPAAVRAAAHLISPDHPVITLQTGLGNLEQIEKIVDSGAVIGGFTFMSGAALGPGIVRLGGKGTTYLGEPAGGTSERVEKLAGLFNDSGLDCRAVGRIVGRLWCKVIVFSAINSLSAVVQVKNGRLLDSMESLVLMKRLVDEGRAVARAHGIDLVYDDLYQLLFDACRRSADGISSMLQDVLSGRRTEIDAQCGALVRLGAEVNIPVPTQQTMVELVKLTERKAAEKWTGEGGR